MKNRLIFRETDIQVLPLKKRDYTFLTAALVIITVFSVFLYWTR